MEIIFLPKADEDLEYWKQTNNTRIMKRISSLLSDMSKIRRVDADVAIHHKNSVGLIGTDYTFLLRSKLAFSLVVAECCLIL